MVQLLTWAARIGLWFAGTLPAEWAALKDLTGLELSGNKFTGEARVALVLERICLHYCTSFSARLSTVPTLTSSIRPNPSPAGLVHSLMLQGQQHVWPDHQPLTLAPLTLILGGLLRRHGASRVGSADGADDLAPGQQPA
jgi:hypothetical protein